MLDYRDTFLISLFFQCFILPFCLWVRETLYFTQESSNYRETLKILLFIHDYNQQDNLAQIQKLMLINVSPYKIVSSTRQIIFRKKDHNFIRNILNSLDMTFFKNLFMISFLSIHLEGIEQFIPITLQHLGIDDVNMNGMMVAVSEMAACVVTIAWFSNKRRLLVFRLVCLVQIFMCAIIYSQRCVSGRCYV